MSRLGARHWNKVSDINITDGSGTSVRYADAVPAVEDPFLFIDRRGAFHIINHRYNNSETSDCGRSTISSHVFSADGNSWHCWIGTEPYGHTVEFDDDTSITFPTLERPYLHFDSNGQMTHINFAAQIEGGDAGCNSDVGRGAGRPKSCAECKFYRHCGTVMAALKV